MDVVDIGGASKRGRPKVPPMQTVVFGDEGEKLVNEAGMETDRRAPDDIRKAGATISDRVKTAVASDGAVVAYPDDHPANDPDIEVLPTGGLKLRKGQNVPGIGVGAKLGDVREGFTNGQEGEEEQKPLPDAMDVLTGQLEELEKQESLDLSAVPVAKDNSGTPLVEVVFHTPFGAMVSYYHIVKQDGQWLILVVDNTQPAAQRFIPKPVTEDGKSKAVDITVTGADNQEQHLRATPLGLQFTMQHYDFVVLMLED